MGTSALKIDDSDELSPTDLPDLDLMLTNPSHGNALKSISFGAKRLGKKRTIKSLDLETRNKLVAGDLAYQAEMQRQREEGVDFLSRQVRESAMSVEVPRDATHRMIDGHYPGSYVKFVKLTDDGHALFVEFMDGHRKGMWMRVMPDFLVSVKTNQPDPLLERMIERGKPVSSSTAPKYRN